MPHWRYGGGGGGGGGSAHHRSEYMVTNATISKFHHYERYFSCSTILRDTPIRLVLKIIVLSLVWSLLLLITALLSERYSAFDDTLFRGIIEYDAAAFASLVILQQAIILFWLRRWMSRFYTFDGDALTVTDGVLFRKHIVIPLKRINMRDAVPGLEMDNGVRSHIRGVGEGEE